MRFCRLPFTLGLVAVYPLRAFQVTRDVSSAQLTSGDRLSVTIRLTRRLPFPLTYMVIEDVMPETLGERRSAKQLVFPWFQRKLMLQYELPQVPRGEHHLHTIRVRTGDVLGLLDKTASFSVTDTVLVFPAYGPVHYKPQAASGEEGAGARALRFRYTAQQWPRASEIISRATGFPHLTGKHRRGEMS